MADTTLLFDIIARDRASSAFKDVGDSADGLGRRLSNISGIAKGAIAGAATAAVAGLGAALFQGGKDAIAYETLTNKVAQTLKATGNAAGTSVKDVQSLAGELESLSGVDEELIINSQNVLATFKNISNNGPGDMFDDATRAALDLSTTMNGDLQGASVMVGKALNDPIRGVTALGRAGVQFTEQQKAQIRAMVEAGDVAGAQRVILGELQSQMGGAAKAAGKGLAGDMARLQDAFSDSFRELSTALLPAMSSFARVLANDVIPAVKGVFTFIGDNMHIFGPLAVVIGGALVAAFTSWAVTAGAAALATIAAMAPVLAIGAAVAALALGIWALIENWDEVWAKIKEITAAVADAVVGFLGDLPGRLLSAFQAAWGAFSSVWSSVFNAVKDFVSDRVDDVVGFISGLPGRLLDVLKAAWGLYWDYYIGVWLAVATFVGEKIGEVVGFVAGLPGRAVGALGAVWGTFAAFWAGLWNGIKDFVAGTWDAVIGNITSLPGRISRAASGMWDGIKESFRGAINAIIGWWNNLRFPKFNIPKIDLGPLGSIGGGHIGGWDLPDIQELHSGGVVSASLPRLPGDDPTERTVRLQVGETVVPNGTSPFPDAREWGRQAAREFASVYLHELRRA